MASFSELLVRQGEGQLEESVDAEIMRSTEAQIVAFLDKHGLREIEPVVLTSRGLEIVFDSVGEQLTF